MSTAAIAANAAAAASVSHFATASSTSAANLL